MRWRPQVNPQVRPQEEEGATGSRLRPRPRPGEAARGALGMAGTAGGTGETPRPRPGEVYGLYRSVSARTRPFLPVHPRTPAAPGMRTPGCRDNRRLSSPPITAPVTLRTAAGAQSQASSQRHRLV